MVDLSYKIHYVKELINNVIQSMEDRRNKENSYLDPFYRQNIDKLKDIIGYNEYWYKNAEQVFKEIDGKGFIIFILVCLIILTIIIGISTVLVQCIYSNRTLFRLQTRFYSLFVPSEIIRTGENDTKLTCRLVITDHDCYNIVIKETNSKNKKKHSIEFVLYPVQNYTLEEAKLWSLSSGVKIINVEAILEQRLTNLQKKERYHIMKLIEKYKKIPLNIGHSIYRYLYPPNTLPKVKMADLR